MEKILDLGESISSFLGTWETRKFVDQEVVCDTFTYLQALSIQHPFLLLYRQAIEAQERTVGIVRFAMF